MQKTYVLKEKINSINIFFFNATQNSTFEKEKTFVLINNCIEKIKQLTFIINVFNFKKFKKLYLQIKSAIEILSSHMETVSNNIYLNKKYDSTNILVEFSTFYQKLEKFYNYNLFFLVNNPFLDMISNGEQKLSSLWVGEEFNKDTTSALLGYTINLYKALNSKIICYLIILKNQNLLNDIKKISSENTSIVEKEFSNFTEILYFYEKKFNEHNIEFTNTNNDLYIYVVDLYKKLFDLKNNLNEKLNIKKIIVNYFPILEKQITLLNEKTNEIIKKYDSFVSFLQKKTSLKDKFSSLKGKFELIFVSYSNLFENIKEDSNVGVDELFYLLNNIISDLSTIKTDTITYIDEYIVLINKYYKYNNLLLNSIFIINQLEDHSVNTDNTVTENLLHIKNRLLEIEKSFDIEDKIQINEINDINKQILNYSDLIDFNNSLKEIAKYLYLFSSKYRYEDEEINNELTKIETLFKSNEYVAAINTNIELLENIKKATNENGISLI